MTLSASLPLTTPPVAPEPLARWVAEIAAITTPERIEWCDGSEAERQIVMNRLIRNGNAVRLNPAIRPDSYVMRSDPADLDDAGSRTYTCSVDPADAGPSNNWADPEHMRKILPSLFAGAMSGRIMYVVAFCMGPLGSPMARMGVQITDSAYLVANMHAMLRVGDDVLARLDPGASWVRGVHSVGRPLRDGRLASPMPRNLTKQVCHFPEDKEMWAYGAAHGSASILAWKPLALRSASTLARDEGWLAEHMALLRLTDPAGRQRHLAAAFPPGCGKTDLATLTSTLPGWKVETLSDDVAWIAPGPDGRLRAINPEAGMYGVVPSTGTALDAISRHTLFTDTAVTDDGDVWWESLGDPPATGVTDWTGQRWTPASGRPAARALARFAVSADQFPGMADSWDDPAGVVLDAIIVGSRRSRAVPLVRQARDWDHGVLMGATLLTEETVNDSVTETTERHDPFGMRRFCGYNLGDHWQHWLDVGDAVREAGAEPPPIFEVNWFRTDHEGRLLWPGFGDNVRVLAWIADRLDGRAQGVETPVGTLPAPGAIPLQGTEVTPATMAALLRLDPMDLLAECEDDMRYVEAFGDHTPRRLKEELCRTRTQLRAMQERRSSAA
ncbi:phosphoenolpyruvate carboxykinase (GTP) [Demequina zhanjiangensis]|uniref:Phosphoenolpyruvate carboxykinase [GTP] n=1 Tax=Demequina zhanjiangensis TaxID=3051659 RepID=A0ABT8G521_9MICO|nr:phosphoenolpyruvate carboxykinase (GTP) [Demequina sp. SYSU T00b26]MDN4474218.1 phosphoenolpyruvate carboxykinase (GTP) [Demequina sp. SYSU T00b26]